MAEAWLDVKGVAVRFGGVVALSGVSFEHRRGEVLGLIGPNGAGKTTLLNALTGLAKPQEGSIRFQQRELVGASPQTIVATGLVRTFQNTELYHGMSARQNVLLGCHQRLQYGTWRAMVGFGRARRREDALRDEVDRILTRLRLHQFAETPIDRLPYGIRKRLEIARAIALQPHVVLLDEPAAGSTDEDRHALVHDIGFITSELGASVILVEHDVELVMSVCDRIVVLNFGEVLAMGSPAEIRANAEVEAAYLGS
jgi:branched-chain amino acid transport system ATP-binding protein